MEPVIFQTHTRNIRGKTIQFKVVAVMTLFKMCQKSITFMFHQFWHVKYPFASSIYELKVVGKPTNKCIKRYNNHIVNKY